MYTKTLLTLTVAMLFLMVKSPAYASSYSLPAVRSIDTMKISRDIAKDKLEKPEFDAEIEKELDNIASMGVTHVAIDTPYDEEFIPLMQRWVSAARKRKLHVWFRGNFSGWEGWFNYPDISRAEHLAKLKDFLTKHPELFANGDIFTACPECENGDPTPPFHGDIAGFRKFMIDEYNAMNDIFKKHNLQIITNYNSMNGALALRVMDKKTTQALGGVVGIDHYVASPEQLASDIRILAESSGGRIVIGEIGVPIPEIHGDMPEKEQAEWMAVAFSKFRSMPEIIAVNYWTSWGGSTALWSKEGQPSSVVPVLKNYFTDKTVPVHVYGRDNKPVTDASISVADTIISENVNGTYQVPYLYPGQKMQISAKGYLTVERVLEDADDTVKSNLEIDKNTLPWWDKMLLWVKDFMAKKW